MSVHYNDNEVILMVERRTVFKPYTIFGFEAREKYLEEMSYKGWHLIGTSPFGYEYTFVKGDPSKVRYYLDYGFTNAGEFFSRMWGFLAFKVKYEVYTDRRPKDRNSLLSHIVMFRYIQILYGFIGLTQLLNFCAQLSILTANMFHPYGLIIILNLLLLIFSSLFVVAMLAVIIILEVQCRKKKQQLGNCRK
jgi:hypothetical protein